MKAAICAIFKNEGPFLEEWVAYHKLVGFDEFVLYDNGSTDDGRKKLEGSWFRDFVRVIDWQFRPGQISAYENFIARFKSEYEWVAFIDVDEFIHPLRFDSIMDLLPLYSDFGAVLINWMNFGPNGHLVRPHSLVMDSYRNRLPDDSDINLHVKSIVRTRNLISPMGPHVAKLDRYPCNARAERIANIPIQPKACFDEIVINHYYTKSLADWELKVNRGRATTLDNPRVQREHSAFSFHSTYATTKDERICRFIPEIRGGLNSLKI